jgi:hypothetical protein
MRWRPRHDRVHSPGPPPSGRFEHAAARFNESDAGHTARGLVRTLGTPRVSLGASAGAPQQVRVTVAWELTWYQWAVDLSEETLPVFELAKGREISELDAAARQWNASATEAGAIVMGPPLRRPHAGESARR